jgi:hypothetical protein
MRFQGALIKEQGVTFAIVIVKYHVVRNQIEAKKAIVAFQPAFPGVPIILMGQDSSKRPYYFGRKDIVKFLSNASISSIPWKWYTVN